MKPQARLPGSVKACAWLALVLCTCTGMASTSEVQILARPEAQVRLAEQAAEAEGPAKAHLAREAAEFQAARARAVRPFRTFRITTLVLLSLATTFALVAALRLLVPAGLSRRPLVLALSTSAIAAAILRTVDGAMEFALARRLSAPMSRVVQAQVEVLFAGQDGAQARALMGDMPAQLPSIVVASTAVATLIVAGGLLAIGQYLRSARVLAHFPPRAPDPSR